ncbi:MAG: hypothetical protein ABH886_03015 [Candidatus Desantisbacteria bacterium]
MCKRNMFGQVCGLIWILVISSPVMAQEQQLEYGFKAALPEMHVFLTNQFYNYGKDEFGKYANKGDAKLAGHSVFIPMSGYIDILSQLNSDLKAEAEFELYRAESVKICKLRGVWSPEEWFNLSMGRDFVPIGTQDKSYYPPSRFRMFTVAPYLYRNVMRSSGWWDTGVFISGKKQLTKQVDLLYNISMTNGPGDSHQTFKLEDVMGTGTNQGYMYEHFHTDARQYLDNNGDKPVCVRLALSPMEGLEFGGSYFKAKYNGSETYGCDYTFYHLLYGSDKLNVACEYGRIGIDVNPTKNPRADKKIHQSSAYIAASYKILQEKYVHFLAPAIRYEIIDPWEEDTSHKGTRKSTSIGVNISPVEHFLIRAAYQHTTEKGPELKNDGVSLETVFDF